MCGTALMLEGPPWERGGLHGTMTQDLLTNAVDVGSIPAYSHLLFGRMWRRPYGNQRLFAGSPNQFPSHPICMCMERWRIYKWNLVDDWDEDCDTSTLFQGNFRVKHILPERQMSLFPANTKEYCSKHSAVSHILQMTNMLKWWDAENGVLIIEEKFMSSHDGIRRIFIF